MPDGNALLTDRTWQDVPGCTGVRIYPYMRKIDTLSSNSFLLSLNDCLILLDPGALPEQMEHMVTVIRAEIARKPRPLLTILTHIHGDHWLQVLENPDFREFPVIYAIQEEGAKAFANNDSRLLQASLFGTRFGTLPVALPLFAESECSRDPDNAEITRPGYPFRYSYGMTGTPGNRVIRCENLLFGTDTLECYHTPGHSPDSICIRVGEILFTGDLHFAATTGIAGLAGWDQEKLIRSIRDIRGVLAGKQVQICCPGHGRPLPASTMAGTLEALQRDVESLEAIEELNVARARQVAAYAEGLMTALGEVFTIIEGRLYYVEYVLEELDESGEAGEVGKLLGSGSIDDLVENFNAFLAEYKGAGKPDIYIMLKAGQVISKMSRIFEREELDWIIDAYLLERAERLISDYMRMAKGHRPPVIVGITDLRPIVSGAIASINRAPLSDEELLDSADDPAKYRKLLAKRIALVNPGADIGFGFREGPGPYLASIDEERMQGLLVMLLEEEIGRDPEDITVSLEPEGDLLMLTMTGTSGSGEEKEEPASQKLRFLEEEATLAGGILRYSFLPGKTVFSLEMGTGSLLSTLLPDSGNT